MQAHKNQTDQTSPKCPVPWAATVETWRKEEKGEAQRELKDAAQMLPGHTDIGLFKARL